jgi:hypothetical protein
MAKLFHQQRNPLLLALPEEVREPLSNADRQGRLRHRTPRLGVNGRKPDGSNETLHGNGPFLVRRGQPGAVRRAAL